VRENEAAERRFFAELVSPRKQALVPALVELEGLVAEPGLKASSRNFAAEASKELPLVRINVTVSLTGGYRQLVTFLRGLETSKHFLTVDKVSLRERGAARDDGEGALNVGVSAWFRADAEEAARAR
jgi:Tfp pilus assembly protein PilO